MARAPTPPGAIGVCQHTGDVICHGWHHGQPCAKVIGKNLDGSIELKCSRCGHIETYRNKPVDNLA